MQSDFESGKNKECRPDMHTYSAVLIAIRISNRSDAIEKAQNIFDSIHLPNTVVFNVLLNIYAERGMGHETVTLTRRMQSDFESGKNRYCLPSEVTEIALLKAFRISGDHTLVEQGHDVLDWFRMRKQGSI
jgi:hypothetical protein